MILVIYKIMKTGYTVDNTVHEKSKEWIFQDQMVIKNIIVIEIVSRTNKKKGRFK